MRNLVKLQIRGVTKKAAMIEVASTHIYVMYIFDNQTNSKIYVLFEFVKSYHFGSIDMFRAEGTDAKASFLDPFEWYKLIASVNTTWCVELK